MAPGNTLTLELAVRLFTRCSPAIIQARAAVAAATGDLRTADHPPNPTLGLSVSNINPQAGTGGGALRDRTVDSAARIDQLIERGGKRAARRETALANLQSAQAMLADTQLRGVQALIESYLNLSAAVETAELLSDAAASYRGSLEAMQSRLKAGDVSQVEVNRTALDAARAEVDAETARLAVSQARTALVAAMGTGPMDPATLVTGIEPLYLTSKSAPAAAMPDAADVAARPDVKASIAHRDAVRGALGIATAARHRDVDLTLGFDHWPTSVTNNQGTGNSYTLGVSLPLYLYDSGKGAVAHARADLQGAESDLRGKLTAAELDRRSALEQLQQAESLASRYRNVLVPSANQILAAEDTAYRRGGASLLDLLDARRNARQVGVSAIGAMRDALAARGRERVAMGRDPLSLFLSAESIAAIPSEVEVVR